jgi:hypothetical protein
MTPLPSPGTTPVKPLIYVMGPITRAPDLEMRRGVLIGNLLISMGYVPITPQTSVIANAMLPKQLRSVVATDSPLWNFWMGLDFHLLRHSTMAIRLPGDSPGADQEARWAEEALIPVYTLREFIKSQSHRTLGEMFYENPVFNLEQIRTIMALAETADLEEIERLLTYYERIKDE